MNDYDWRAKTLAYGARTNNAICKTYRISKRSANCPKTLWDSLYLGNAYDVKRSIIADLAEFLVHAAPRAVSRAK